MVTERQVLGKIEVLENGLFQIREDSVVERDGVEIARLYHRRTLAPGTDVTNEPSARLRAIAAVVWTPDVITAYRAAMARARENDPTMLIPATARRVP